MNQIEVGSFLHRHEMYPGYYYLTFLFGQFVLEYNLDCNGPGSINHVVVCGFLFATNKFGCYVHLDGTKSPSINKN